MGRTCTICSHPEREAIEAALVRGDPFRHIAERYGTASSSLVRHREHVRDALVQAKESKSEERGQTLLEQVRWLQQTTLKALETAERDDDTRCLLAAVKEARGNLELLGKLTGELATGPTAVAIAGAQATATSAVETQLQALTDEELAEELRAALEAVEARIAAKETV